MKHEDIGIEIERSTNSIRNKIYEEGWAQGGSLKAKKVISKKKEILYKYIEERKTTIQIGKELGFCDHTIARVLQKEGFDTSHGSGRYSSVKDVHIFDKIDSSEKAYWIGYFLGDGNVPRAKNTVRLDSIDREHLAKYCNFLGLPFSAIKEVSHKSDKHPRSKIYRVCANSIILAKAVGQYGIVPNKTYEPSFKILPVFTRDFLRGFVDADGYIHPKGRHCQITGSQHTTNVLSGWLNENDFHNKTYQGSTEKTFQLFVMRKENCIRFLNYLYQDSEIYLDRKYERYLSIIAHSGSDA